MKIKSQTNLAAWMLRLGLAFVFLYAGFSTLQHPLDWVGYLPTFLTKMLTAVTLIKFIAIYELLLAGWLVSGQYVRYTARLSALTLAGIVVFNLSSFLITFRDVGLVFMGLGLAFIEDK
jgi:uncharacterized membrane protein YphA (DoxX/SURF4 family)